MPNVIEPIRNKDGSIKTNVQVIREMSAILDRLRDGVPGQTDKQRQAELDAYYNIINNEPEIHEYVNYIASIENDAEAQKQIELTLRPVPVKPGAGANA